MVAAGIPHEAAAMRGPAIWAPAIRGAVTQAAAMLAAACLAGCAGAPLPAAPAAGEAVAIRVDPRSQRVTVDDPSPTVSVIWDRALQEAIVRASPGPTISARAFAILHTVLYDVWSAFDPVAVGTAIGSAMVPPEEATEAMKAEAMSYAAHATLSAMFPADAERFDAVMWALGYDPDPLALSRRPVGLGLVTAGRVMTARGADGSNWGDGFRDTTGYVPVNASPLEMRDPARWTPENRPIDPETRTPYQTFYTPQWAHLRPFALPAPAAFRNGAPEPFFATGLSGRVDMAARTVSLDDGRVLAVTPGLVGPVVNPGFIAQAEAVVADSAGLTDREKLIAEFWEDGPGTAFPPGTWMVFGHFVSARDNHSTDQDAKLFFLLANALFDASIACWDAKLYHDSVRPVRAVRTLGRLGLIGTPGVDEQTGETGHVIRAWGGPGEGTRTILASRFLTYQTPTLDPSPPFPEYPSGHSSFSAAAAEVLRAVTGSDAFGASVRFAPGSSRFEPGVTPAAPVELRWATFTEAADEAGLSRRFGGIHFEQGDIDGRMLGRRVGRAVLARGRSYIEGRPAL